MSPADPQRPALAQLLGHELKTLLPQMVPTKATQLQARQALHRLKGAAAMCGEREFSLCLSRLDRRLARGDASAQIQAHSLCRQVAHSLAIGEVAWPFDWPMPPPDLDERAVDEGLLATYLATCRTRLEELEAALQSNSAERAIHGLHALKGAAAGAGDEVVGWFVHGLEEAISKLLPGEEQLMLLEQWLPSLRELVQQPNATLHRLRRGDSLPGPRSTAPPSTLATSVEEAPAEALELTLDRLQRLSSLAESLQSESYGHRQLAERLDLCRRDLARAMQLLGPPRVWGPSTAALDALAGLDGELQQLGEQARISAEVLGARLSGLGQESSELVGSVKHLVQVPIHWLFDQVTAALAKPIAAGEVELRTGGGEILFDQRVLRELVDPLIQLATNAIAHACQSASHRLAQGKPAALQIQLSALFTGEHLRLLFSDDGPGVDLAKVRERGSNQGLLRGSELEADPEQLLRLLFLPGFSTRDQADLLAGRGIGLHLVRASVERIGGRMGLVSTEGMGVRITIELLDPGGLTPVLWLQVGYRQLAVPARRVRKVRQRNLQARREAPAPAQRPPSEPAPPHLATFFGAQQRGSGGYELELKGQRQSFRVVADQVGEVEDRAIAPLSPLVREAGPYMGAIFEAAEQVRLVVDVDELERLRRLLAMVARPHPTRQLASACEAEDVRQLQALHELCLPDSNIQIAKEHERPFAQVWTHWQGLEPDAYLVCWLIGDEYQLLAIGVRPSARERGLAQSLLKASWRSVTEGSRVLLEVGSGNLGARSLYEKLGFMELRRRAGYYADGQDAVEMLGVMGSGRTLLDPHAARTHLKKLGLLPAESGKGEGV